MLHLKTIKLGHFLQKVLLIVHASVFGVLLIVIKVLTYNRLLRNWAMNWYPLLLEGEGFFLHLLVHVKDILLYFQCLTCILSVTHSIR